MSRYVPPTQVDIIIERWGVAAQLDTAAVSLLGQIRRQGRSKEELSNHGAASAQRSPCQPSSY